MDIQQYRELVHQNTKGFIPKNALEIINKWLDTYLIESNTKKVVIGISGGKDSTIVAKILADKLGCDNVVGLLMPNGKQLDIEDSIRVAKLLNIEYHIINIKQAYDAIINMIGDGMSEEAKINIAPRIRMTTLYTYGQTHGCRVAGTGNLSEVTLGYFTKHGDGAHDFNTIRNFTSLEVMRIGEELGLPLELVYKTPDDGLSGMSDEDKLGITYIDMHNYLRKGKTSVPQETLYKIMNMERKSLHKNSIIPSVEFDYVIDNLPKLGELVKLNLKNGKIEIAILTETSFYDEGVVFETIDTADIRIQEVEHWEYL